MKLLVRVFWSLYFVLGIAVIGLIMGYGVTLVLFLFAFLLGPWPKISKPIEHFAEYVQCYSIRMLLQLQPWLKCEENFQPIFGFYNKYGTRKVMFVANHRSNLDTFILISLIPGLRGMAKSSLFYNIFFAPFMWLVGFVPVKKGSVNGFMKGLNLLENKILNKFRPALVFPETTRCQKNKIGFNKFSTAVFETARRSQALVVPILISDTDQLFGRGDFWLNPFKPVKFRIFDFLNSRDYPSAQDLCHHVQSMLSSEKEKPICS